MTTFKPFFTLLALCLIFSCSSSDDTTDMTSEEMEAEEMEMEMEQEDNSSSNSGLIRSIDDGFKISYEYTDGLLVRSSGNDSNTDLNITYIYDSNDDITSKSIFEATPSETFNNTVTYEYDTTGRLIAFSSDQTGNALITYQNNQAFVDFGTAQLILELDLEGKVIRLEADNFYKIFTYDTTGNMILNQRYDSITDELIDTIQYTYDSNDNPFFNQLQSIYLQEFISILWIGSFDTSLYYIVFPYLPNNLTSISFNNSQPDTFTYTYNTANQIITAEENIVSDGSTENYNIEYY